MTFEQAVRTCLRKYADIGGRARRAEYWWFVLFNLILGLVASVVDAMLGTAGADGGGLFNGLTALALLLPGICVAVRRLHDLDKSGWWLLLVLIPLIGALVLLFFFIQRGTVGENRFGADPI